MQDNAIAISFFVSEVAANRPNFCINHEVYPTPVNEHRKRKVIQTENTTKAFYSGPPVKDQKGVKKSLGQGSRNEALFIHAARGYLSR